MQRASRGLTKLRGNRREFVEAAADEHQVETTAGQLLGVGAADTVRGARDHCNRTGTL